MWAVWNEKEKRWLVNGSENYVRVFTSERSANHWVKQAAMPPHYLVRPVTLTPEDE